MNQGSDFWLTPAPVSGQTVNATISNWLLLSYDVFRLTSDGVWRMIYDRESISLHSGQLSGLSQQKSKNPGVFFFVPSACTLEPSSHMDTETNPYIKPQFNSHNWEDSLRGVYHASTRSNRANFILTHQIIINTSMPVQGNYYFDQLCPSYSFFIIDSIT